MKLGSLPSLRPGPDLRDFLIFAVVRVKGFLGFVGRGVVPMCFCSVLFLSFWLRMSELSASAFPLC